MYGQMMKKNHQDRVEDYRGDYVKADIIQSYDLSTTLDALKKVAVQRGANASFEFYIACLDRIDELITERNSKVGKDEVVQILRTLSYFRPREYEQKDKAR